ncbi:MAG: twin-arginine translocation signal domain-containing protein [Candidatus Eisenbacteria bacterium]|nr:twin-arginine translocation signal domain-containing protein [Candidatus Eisenbacteria bacterium]
MTKPVDDTATTAVDRRSFMKGAAAGAASAASALVSHSGNAHQAPGARPSVARPTEADGRADFVPPEPRIGAQFVRNPGSDYMVDVFKALDFDYVAVNPGSAFEGIHESLINHGGNRKPEILTVLHEEAGAAMAHGYAKAAGKPMMTLMHGTVGLLHASMGLFQAWCDRVPIFAIVGHNRNPTSPVNRPHSAQDMGSLVRDFMKMDDEPTELSVFGNIAMRAYTLGRTPPMGPTLLVVDSELQEAPIPDPGRLSVPRFSMPSLPQGDSAAVREAARLLVTAERPLIRPGKLARTPAGWDLLVELAELLQAPVDVGNYASWQDFPSWHALYGSGGPGYRPDVIIGLELNDMTASVRAVRAAGGTTISICSEYLSQGHNVHDFGNYSEVDVAMAADGEATLPALIEEIKRQSADNATRVRTARGRVIATAHKAIRERELDAARYGWNSSPISVPRMVAELGWQIQTDDWAIVSGHQFTGTWQRRLLNHDRFYRYNGDCGGFGVGYDTPASVGGALAHKAHGRLSIGIVGDGDFHFVGPGALWTAAHHKIPLLLIIHNNRAYHAEVMLVQRTAARRGRGNDQVDIGNVIRDPAPDYAKIAQGYGVYAEGPISDPDALAPALERALARVRAGEPALLDVISQPR